MSKGRRSKNQDIKKARDNKSNIVLKVFSLIFLIVTVIFYYKILQINMLPTKYLIILGVVIGIITSLIIFIIIKRNNKNILRAIFVIISIIVMGIYTYGISNIDATIKFIKTLDKISQETEEYYVVVLKTSKYNEIKDLSGKDIHVFLANEDYEDIKKEILNKAEVNFKEDDSIQTLANDILEGKSEAVLLSNSQYLMLQDENKEFIDKTKIINRITHQIQNSADKVIDTNSKSLIENGVFNIYISGIDTNGNISNVSRTDVNMVVTVNTNTHKILMTSIPRDYYVTLHSKKAKDKLTHSGVYGIKETVSTVEDLLGIDINYYIRVNFTTLIKVVDTLDGVDVNSEYDFKAVSGQKFKKGINHVNGEEALAFSRERHAFETGDRQRVKNQQAVLTAIINKALSSSTILTKYTSLLQSLSSSFQTNIPQDNISMLVKGQLENMKGWDIQTVSLNGAGAMMTTYSYGKQKLYVMVPDEATVTNAKKKISEIVSK